MLSLPAQSRSAVTPARHWQTVSAIAAAGMIGAGSTVAVGWLGDGLATAMESAFLTRGQPRDLTIVYASTRGEGRTHGLNRLAHAGMVRRVVGGQWHPVPALQAMAKLNQIEAYSLPAGVIRRLFRETAAGQFGHLTRSGLGTSADPRQGGGRLNRTTREELVRLVRPAGEEALLFRTFPIGVALVPIAFMEGTAAVIMTRDAMAIARAAQAGGGMVIAQLDRVGTLAKLGPSQIEVPDSLVDVLVNADPRDRTPELFLSTAPAPNTLRRLTH